MKELFGKIFSDTEIKAWSGLKLHLISVEDQIIKETIQILAEARVNGGALIYCFEIPDNLIYWYPKEDINNFFSNLLLSDSARNAMPELKIGDEFTCQPGFEQVRPFLFEGDIAESLYYGGAYKKYQGTPTEAMEIARKFCKAIYSERMLDVGIYKTYDNWTEWFYDVAWDVTWVLFDKSLKRLWVICLTDTD